MQNTTQKTTYQETLMQIGLNGNQAWIYEYLLKNGPQKASKITIHSPFKRQLVYKILDELEAMNLVIKIEPKGKVAVFEPAHPSRLADYISNESDRLSNAKLILDTTLPHLSSEYNFSLGKPGVRFFEGKDGLIELYEELLKQNAPMDSIEDKGEMVATIEEYAKSYPKKRVKRGIFNRVIAPSTTPINETNELEMRSTRLIPVSRLPFRMDIKICGNLVSLASFQKNNPIGILIDNKEISDNFKLLFNFLWSELEKPNVNPERS